MSLTLDHLGIAVRSIAESRGLYEALGANFLGIEDVAHEGVRVGMLELGEFPAEKLSKLGETDQAHISGPEDLLSFTGFVAGAEALASSQLNFWGAYGGRIELLEALEEDSAVGRFLAKRGEGLHHLALRVGDLDAAVAKLRACGVRLVTDEIQVGAGGHRYVFVHPRSANGVLVELVEARERQ